MRRSLGSLLVLSGLMGAGCSSSTTLDIDAASTPDAGMAMGSDAGSDAGLDANLVFTADAFVAPDTGVVRTDAGSSDAGTVLPPIDATSPFGDAGTLGDPAWMPLTVLTDGSHCDPLVPCGGDITGTWDVGGGCFEVPLGTALMRCPGATATGSGQSRGRVSFDGTLAHRVAQSEVDVQITVPRICASFVGGCPAIETQIRMQVPDAACVTQTDMSCLCQARVTNVIDDVDAYTTSGDEIIGTGSGKHWAYCLTGDSLQYQDVSSTGMREPGIIDLTRR